MLKPEAIELLQKVKAHILEEPRRLNMDNWGITRTRYNDTFGRDKVKDTYAESCPVYEFPPCNTVGCIAGWTAMLSGIEPDNATLIVDNAIVLLGLSDGTSGDNDPLSYGKLFYPTQWDGNWGKTYAASTSVEGKAQVVADYIDYFIETRGQ